MLKRLVKEATSGFSSSGEQTSKPGKRTTAPKRKNSLSSGSESAQNASRRKGKPASESDKDVRRKREETPTEDESTQRKTKANDAESRKRASRMKRQPLLDLKLIQVIHTSMRGKKKKRARQELLDALASYDVEDTGSVDADKFKKCLAKIGIKFKRSDDVDAVVRCFTKGNSADKQQDNRDEDDESNADTKFKRTLVDYVAFMDFACNGRDSEKLSALAEKLRRVIKAYDAKHDRATSIPFNVGTELKKLDKAKRGWISSDRFTDFLADHERPTLRVSGKEIDVLTERFKYEYGKGELGIDYVQFARWLQPSLHVNKKELHARVKKLIQSAQDVGGWELDEVFEAMDGNGDGHVSAEELKQALVEMGLPLTDAQLFCLVDEYDVNGDDRIEYDEFVSLFGAPKAKRHKPTTRDTKRKQENESETEAVTAKRKARTKTNARNTFSWAIHKAFARKHAAQGHTPSDDKRPGKAKQRKRVASSSSDDDDTATKTVDKNRKKKEESESESDESSDRPARRKRTARVKSSRRQQQSDDSAQSESEPARKGTTASKKSTKRKHVESSTESEPDHGRRRRSTSRARKSDKRKPRTRGESEDDDEESNKHTDRERKKEKKKKERKQPVSTTTEDSMADTQRRRGREHRSASVVSRRSRRGSATTRERAASTARASPRRRKQSLQPHRRQRSVSRTRSRESATGRSRRRRNTRSKSATTRQAATESEEDSGRSASDAQSGLDRDQVRRLQRQPRRRRKENTRSGKDSSTEDLPSHEDDETEEEETTPSDCEYAKCLRKSLRRAFDFFDLDHSATIDKRELGHVLRALGHEFSSQQLDRDMRRADLDRNNALDFHEFVRFVTKQLSQKAFLLSKQREMEIRRSFQSLDTDKNGCLDEHEFEYLIYKVLQVELSVEEQDALLDFVDTNGDGQINEEEFISFMKTMEAFHRRGSLSKNEQRRMMNKLDGASKLACSAMKKLIRGAPMDLDSNLLMFFGVPSNYRPALSSTAVCRSLNENSLRHALSFPCPETIVAMAQDPMRVGAKREVSGLLSLVRPSDAAADNEEALMVLKQAESWQLHAIVSLKRATGVPKPFDTREEDVVKRCVHVCLYQEQEEVTKRRRRRKNRETTEPPDQAASERGLIVGNVHEIPVHWSPQEEDVWEFSKKTTKEDKYKFLVRTNTVNDRLFLLVEFIVHLRMTSDDALTKKQRRARFKSDGTGQVREMTACWCKIPIRTLLARRVDVYRAPQKLWGGTVDSPIDIEQDEVLRRRTGWRAITNVFKKPSPPTMGIKSAPIETYPDDVQGYVRKTPPLILAPFTALPIIAEYMTAMQGSLWLKSHITSPTLCEPVLALLPQIIDDHEALSAFRRVFDAEVNGVKTLEDRQKKFQDLVLRMWPSFLVLLGDVPQSLLQDASSGSTRRLSLLSPTSSGSGQAPVPATGSTNQRPLEQQARSNLLQTTAQGKLRLRDIPVAAAPFHVREVAFQRLI